MVNLSFLLVLPKNIYLTQFISVNQNQFKKIEDIFDLQVFIKVINNLWVYNLCEKF